MNNRERAMGKRPKKSETRTTSEKSISLRPLNFKEALANLLAVRPKPKNEKEDEDTEKEEWSDG